MTIPIDYRINDNRSIKDFSKKTLSNYLLKDVMTIFGKSLLTCKIEESCNWAIELLVSGCYDKFWEKIFSIFLKNININNPILPIFIYKRYCKFLNYYSKFENKLELRNNQVIRNMFCELCIVICNSLKLKPLGFAKITQNDFDLNFLSSKMKADKETYISDKLKFGDPSEMKIIMNEFTYCLNTKNYELCNYWLSWALEFEKKNTKNNKMYICGLREIDNIDSKYKNDLCWFIWEIILKESSNLSSSVSENIQALYKLYKYDFKPSQKGKKSNYFLYAIKYFTDIYTVDKQIIPNLSIIIQACSNINYIFVDKINNCVNKEQKIVEQKIHEENVSILTKTKLDKDKKEKLKVLKEIANEKMRLKINTVEKIDSLILSGNFE
jgi:hypothetical protein